MKKSDFYLAQFVKDNQLIERHEKRVTAYNRGKKAERGFLD